MNKRTIGIIIGVIVAAIGFWVLTKPSEQPVGAASNHIKSEGSTGVVFIEYGDFQCPACAAYYPTIKEVSELYKDRVTFQFRHFPLESLHKNARAASRAAEAAGNQGKFWEMHDTLYENQTSWQETNDPMTVFEGYARQIGIENLDQFTLDYKSSEVNAVINADLSEGRKIGANSTPTFVLDGKKIDENPAASVEAFSKLFDDAIAAKTGQPAPTTEQQPTDTQEQTTPAEENTTE